ncbi:MAG: hypothetical protein CMC15_18590 [Flavobacteriaceae bacterium]|mgnify:CR=1 FL=1|nr:hypothetical protein [Flavobacteriaceae bacterium]|tara:strand:- start:487 stop:678 length:192 start_codon:yes stop_codon:yes gene_type:complete
MFYILGFWLWLKGFSYTLGRLEDKAERGLIKHQFSVAAHFRIFLEWPWFLLRLVVKEVMKGKK